MSPCMVRGPEDWMNDPFKLDYKMALIVPLMHQVMTEAVLLKID